MEQPSDGVQRAIVAFDLLFAPFAKALRLASEGSFDQLEESASNGFGDAKRAIDERAQTAGVAEGHALAAGHAG